MQLRVLPFEVGTPARNMALDEALLKECGPPTLRLYGWDPPGLSLGYFQRAGDFAEVPGRHEIVRRLTGGGAIYHSDELTFSLAVDASLLPPAVPDGYRLLHEAAACALAEVGVPVRRVREGPPGGARPRKLWCFAEPGLHDLVDPRGRKLLGSAQRRIAVPRPRVLHHGSLVLERPEATPFCAAVADTVDPESIRPALCRALAEHIAGALKLRPEPGAFSDAERAVAGHLEAARYADPAFTELR